ncbi:hypothetical protein M378DRAFT_161591 [Amanita muscaria Koide BX008]|uniref:Uncharacterized protein n=1 Tax=Amanita muscaria (strain Koide BX008) TaxID=946122 RepID=A0A0C2X9E5_AMAMK|nr:hypothetical protein M378DRAFT_161591 [Amanita muscaria Koide BX008]
MNVVRRQLLSQFSRSYSTARQYVPPAQLRNVKRNLAPNLARAPPESPSFYTGRPVYYDQVTQLEKAISHARSALRSLQLLPLPEFARASLPPLRPVWKDQEEMEVEFQSRLTTTRYRRVTSLLSQLNEYYRIAATAECTDLAQGIHQVISLFESSKKDAYLARGKRKPVVFDNYGRSYTVGKRKTSSARVWIIPVYDRAQTLEQEGTEEALLGLEQPKIQVSTTTVVVNNLSLSEYFPLPADRERITRPFKVAGLLGAFNVFAIVRGGGTTGQSGALAHGIAKGLAAHRSDIEPLLKKAKLLRRDPRMVERKKTGLAKARKRYTWVKR